MKKLDEDVAILKSMGCITVAAQYKRMAKALMKIRKFCDSRDFIIYLEDVATIADGALNRFKGGVK